MNVQPVVQEGRGISRFSFSVWAHCPAPINSVVVEDASRLDNAADEENPLVIRRKAPHNQRIKQTPSGAPLSAALDPKINEY
jgi:hypothetical protein